MREKHAGLLDWVEAMCLKGGAVFGVVVVQRNGMLHTNREICALEINQDNVTLQLPYNVSIQQSYSSGMQASNLFLLLDHFVLQYSKCLPNDLLMADWNSISAAHKPISHAYILPTHFSYGCLSPMRTAHWLSQGEKTWCIMKPLARAPDCCMSLFCKIWSLGSRSVTSNAAARYQVLLYSFMRLSDRHDYEGSSCLHILGKIKLLILYHVLLGSMQDY